MCVLVAFMLATVPPCACAPHSTCGYAPLCVLRPVPHGTLVDHPLMFPAFHMHALLCRWGGPLFWSASLGLRVFQMSYPHTTAHFCTLRVHINISTQYVFSIPMCHHMILTQHHLQSLRCVAILMDPEYQHHA